MSIARSCLDSSVSLFKQSMKSLSPPWGPSSQIKAHSLGRRSSRCVRPAENRKEQDGVKYWIYLILKTQKAKLLLLTSEDLKAYLCQCGKGGLVEHADAAHLLNFSWVDSLPSDGFQDIPDGCRLLKCSFEETWEHGHMGYLPLFSEIHQNCVKILSFVLLTGRLFCEVLGCGGGGVGSWLSSFFERTSLKSVRMTDTPHRYCSCLVTSGIDSFSLKKGRRQKK